MGGQTVSPPTNAVTLPQPPSDDQKPREAPEKNPSSGKAKSSGFSLKPSDYISLTALVLSLTTAVYSGSNWFFGGNPHAQRSATSHTGFGTPMRR
jgi:hypothetical protein